MRRGAMTRDVAIQVARAAAGGRPSWSDAIGSITRLPRYLRLASALARDPAVPKRAKAALASGLVYVALPIDLVPGVIPVLGQLDDLAALLLGLRLALATLPPGLAAAHLAAAGLTDAQLDGDLRIARATLAWAAGRALRTSSRLVGRAGGLGVRAARGLLSLASRKGR